MVGKNDPATVYQWVGILQATSNDNISAIAPVTLSPTQMEDVEVFHINYVDKRADAELQAITAGREDAVVEIMEDLYGAPRTWQHVYTSTTYTSPMIRIYEDDYYDAEELGLVEIPEGISLAAEAISLAAEWGVPVPTALTILTTALDIYELAQLTYEEFTLDAYRGSRIVQRTGTATPSGGSEIPLVTATKTSLRVITFLETPDDDYVIGSSEVIYAPSEYKYSYTTLAADTYNAY